MKIGQWWKQSSRVAKVVTFLAVLLTLQMGLCFASPGEPAWFDSLINVPYTPSGEFRVGLLVAEAVLCVCTLVLLIIAVLVWMAHSLKVGKARASVVSQEYENVAAMKTDQDKLPKNSGDPNDR